LRADEEERQRRAFEERRRQAEIAALQEAAVQKARMEAEAQARLAEMASRHDHERQLRLLGADKHKKRLTLIIASLGAFLFVAAIGGGVLIKSQIDKANLAEANAAELRAQIDESKAAQAKLERDLASTKDPEQIAALTAKLAEQQRRVQEMERTGQVPRQAVPAPAMRAPKPAGAPAKPCNCTPGDPLCSCL
jgi:colicin import membrane protein